jgi:rSAM/selenodomain-associated transferase 2
VNDAVPLWYSQERNGNMPSIVIPTLNAAATLGATLASVAGAAAIVVADGGSTDATISIAQAGGAQIVHAPRGRGGQLAAGIAATSTRFLLLLHADTRLAPGWRTVADAFMDEDGRAGYFRFALDTADPRARRLERIVAWRCRVLALPYGDQGLLISRRLLDSVGGMRPLPLMEDVDLATRLGRHLVPLDCDAVTSAAKWEREGWTRRSARNLGCLALWYAGVPPHRIARLYR